MMGERTDEAVNRWLATLPTTNARIVITLCIAVFTTAFVLSMMALSIDVQDTVIGIIYAYLAAQGGFDYKQYRAKRETYAPETSAPPAPPAPQTADREDATQPDDPALGVALQQVATAHTSHASLAQQQVNQPATAIASAAHDFDMGA